MDFSNINYTKNIWIFDGVNLLDSMGSQVIWGNDPTGPVVPNLVEEVFSAFAF
jgi:hypothetical protein